jgi:hypothetical protein
VELITLLLFLTSVLSQQVQYYITVVTLLLFLPSVLSQQVLATGTPSSCFRAQCLLLFLFSGLF